MPAAINVAANFALGGALVLVLKASPAIRREMVSWGLLFLLFFEALVFTPVAVYLFRFYPQWSMLYWFDPQMFPRLDNWIGLLSFLATALNFAAAVVGFALARLGIIIGQRWLAWGPALVGVACVLLMIVAYGDRVAFIGDYDAFWQGTADLLFKRLAGWIGLGGYAAAVGFLFWVRSRFADHDPTLV